MAANMRFPLLCALLASGGKAENNDPLPGLRRVVVLARHGNRAPNPQIEELCPTFWKEVFPKFGVAPAALSLVGMAENHENGVFLRHRYREFLPEGAYSYDGTFSFFSERVERNIVSTAVMARGMFPLGTGMKGFMEERPNVVPIATTQDGADVIMNCPRDGPCQRKLSHDKKAWVKANEMGVYENHKELFRAVSEACGYPLEPGKIKYKGKAKTLTWAAKAVMDAFTFSENEGLDPTMGGRINMTTIKAFHGVVEGMVQGMNFGKPHQITYWAGDFIPTFLSLARVPLVEPVNKLHVFLNHRELIYAVAHMLGMPIAFPGQRPDSLPSGCSLVVEVYDHGVRIFFWAPSRPSHDMKGKYLREKLPMTDLYKHGVLLPTPAYGCAPGQVCPVESLAYSFVNWVSRTGTYVQLCNVSVEDTYFAKGEASLGVMEHWVQPEVLAARGVNLTRPSVKAMGLTASDAEALGFALAADDSEDSHLRGVAGGAGDAASFTVLGVAGFSMAMSLVTGVLGFAFGRQTARSPAAPAGEAPYVQLS
mmetsp:Transcript_1350/g.3576  ORF Transcript_1350/g.3576 Transcript_1350/m.3576 type:complete len:537 (+) Transcript_1350:88-1698(+)